MAFYDGAVLKVVHVLIGLLTYVHLLASVLMSWKPWAAVVTKFTGEKRTLSRCKEDGKRLWKLPRHIGLLVGEEISYGDVCCLLIWCMALGISYLSVFDLNGNLKKNVVILKSHLDRLQDKIMGNDKCKYTYQFHHSHSKKENSSEGAQVHIALLSPSDGRLELVQKATDYCHAVAKRLLKATDISSDLISSTLHATKGFPDPDMLIRFGPTESLLGYLPWQIHLTEILSMSTHWSIDYQSFLDVMYQYARTQQRCGK